MVIKFFDKLYQFIHWWIKIKAPLKHYIPVYQEFAVYPPVLIKYIIAYINFPCYYICRLGVILNNITQSFDWFRNQKLIFLSILINLFSFVSELSNVGFL